MNYKYFTSESVCSGHPDKICDQISDAIVDEALFAYPNSKVAVETMVTKNKVVIAGEVTCPKKLNYEKIAREVIKSLDYTDEIFNFTYHSPIDIYIHEQSKDIALGVESDGAGDQGMMFGYAVNETPQLMPLPIALAHNITKKIDFVRKNILFYLRPDGKSEVKVLYENGKPKNIEKIVIAVPHNPEISEEQVKSDVYKYVVVPILNKYKYKIEEKNLIVNGTGKWEIGGPASDTGLTGRKIIVDTYGGMSRQGGGCFSGKDPTKVDRSAAYAGRFIAKNIVAKGLAERCEVQIAYVIGRKNPITKAIETFNTEKTNLETIEKYAWSLIDLSVGGIIKDLDLRKPIFRKSASYGHFGRSCFSWEVIKY